MIVSPKVSGLNELRQPLLLYIRFPYAVHMISDCTSICTGSLAGGVIFRFTVGTMRSELDFLFILLVNDYGSVSIANCTCSTAPSSRI